MAPALNFLTHWVPKTGERQSKLWEKARYLLIYHYGQQKLLPLHYDFITDAHRYHLCPRDHILPTLNIQDDVVILMAASQDFAAEHR